MLLPFLLFFFSLFSLKLWAVKSYQRAPEQSFSTKEARRPEVRYAVSENIEGDNNKWEGVANSRAKPNPNRRLRAPICSLGVGGLRSLKKMCDGTLEETEEVFKFKFKIILIYFMLKSSIRW